MVVNVENPVNDEGVVIRILVIIVNNLLIEENCCYKLCEYIRQHGTDKTGHIVSHCISGGNYCHKKTLRKVTLTKSASYKK